MDEAMNSTHLALRKDAATVPCAKPRNLVYDIVGGLS
jgi:hypothetical protein